MLLTACLNSHGKTREGTSGLEDKPGNELGGMDCDGCCRMELSEGCMGSSRAAQGQDCSADSGVSSHPAALQPEHGVQGSESGRYLMFDISVVSKSVFFPNARTN